MKNGKISSKRDMLTLVSARNEVGFFLAFVYFIPLITYYIRAYVSEYNILRIINVY